MAEYPVMYTSKGIQDQMEQTYKAVKAIYKMYRAMGHKDQDWERQSYGLVGPSSSTHWYKGYLWLLSNNHAHFNKVVLAPPHASSFSVNLHLFHLIIFKMIYLHA